MPAEKFGPVTENKNLPLSYSLTRPVRADGIVSLLKTLPFTPRTFELDFQAGVGRPTDMPLSMWRDAHRTRYETRTNVWTHGGFFEANVDSQVSHVDRELLRRTAQPSIPEHHILSVPDDRGGSVRAYDVFLTEMLPELLDNEYGPVSGTLVHPRTWGLTEVRFIRDSASVVMGEPVGSNTRRNLKTWFEGLGDAA